MKHLFTAAATVCTSVMLLCGASCRKSPNMVNNSGPLAAYTGVTSISAIAHNPLPTHPEYDNMRVTYTLNYDYQQIITAVPDKYRDVFGTIYFSYSNDNKLLTARRQVKDPATGTLVGVDSLAFAYSGNNLDKILLYQHATGAQVQYSFFYTGDKLSRITESNDYSNLFNVYEVAVDNDGSIYHTYCGNLNQNANYLLGKQVNNLSASLPVWAAMTLVQMKPCLATFPLYMNRTLTGAMYYDSGWSRTDYSYLQLNNKTTRLISNFDHTIPDTVIYGY